MWKSLSQQSAATHSFGYIRDADGNLRRELGLQGDGAKVVYWEKGATDPKQLSLYEGMSSPSRSAPLLLLIIPLPFLISGPLKFTELLAFLSSPLPPASGAPRPSSAPSDASSSPPSSEPAPPNASQLARAAEREKAQARWAEEERRDQARLQRMAERKRALAEAAERDEEGTGTGTEEAGAEPAKAPEVGGEKKEGSKTGEPEPAASPEVEVEGEGKKPRETGKESVLTEEQEEVVEVVEGNVGGPDEEVEPELKVVELEQEGERKRDEL